MSMAGNEWYTEYDLVEGEILETRDFRGFTPSLLSPGISTDSLFKHPHQIRAYESVSPIYKSTNRYSKKNKSREEL